MSSKLPWWCHFTMSTLFVAASLLESPLVFSQLVKVFPFVLETLLRLPVKVIVCLGDYVQANGLVLVSL